MERPPSHPLMTSGGAGGGQSPHQLFWGHSPPLACACDPDSTPGAPRWAAPQRGTAQRSVSLSVRPAPRKTARRPSKPTCPQPLHHDGQRFPSLSGVLGGFFFLVWVTLIFSEFLSVPFFFTPLKIVSSYFWNFPFPGLPN